MGPEEYRRGRRSRDGDRKTSTTKDELLWEEKGETLQKDRKFGVEGTKKRALRKRLTTPTESREEGGSRKS